MRCALPVWGEIAERIGGAAEDVRDRRAGTFYYVESVCWGAEELGDPRAIPLLGRLHGRPALHGNVCRSGFQADYFAERQAMMELMIGRALARCGSPLGFEILIAYLEDTRASLAEGAHSRLIALIGQDRGVAAPSLSPSPAGGGGR
jgi:hypothetical protein